MATLRIRSQFRPAPISISFCLAFLLGQCAFLFAEDASPAPEAKRPDVTPARKPANVMSFAGADWLERPGREEEERPDLVLKAMELKETDVVVDFGCGSGFYTRRMAQLVPKGKVLAIDIQPPMLELVRKGMEKDKLTNIEPILSTETDSKLPKGAVDWIILVDVYHEFQQPEPMLKQMLEALAPGGRIALVEFRGEGESAADIRREHRMTPKEVLSEWNPAGFELIDFVEGLPKQHLFIFRKRSDCSCK